MDYLTFNTPTEVGPTGPKCVLQRFKNLVNSPHFCAMCLRIEDLCSIDSEFDIFINGNTMSSMQLKDIINIVFRDTHNILTSSHICRQCTDKTLQSYVFIENVTETTRIIRNHVNNLFMKTAELESQLDDNCNYGNSKFIIVVENNTNIRDNKETDRIDYEEETGNLSDNVFNNDSYVTKINCAQQDSLQDMLTLNTETTIKSVTRTRKRKLNTIALKTQPANENKVTKPCIIQKTETILLQPKIRPVKTKNNAYKCVECDVVLITFKQWKEHENTYHKKLIPKCQVCSKIFKSHRNLVAHYAIHNVILCKVCYVIILDTELAEHMRSHYNKEYPCQHCNLVYDSDSSLETHLKTNHSGTEKAENGKEVCLLCLKHHHKDKNHLCRFSCPDCTEIPCVHNKYIMSYREQALNKVTRIKCVDCDYMCIKKEHLIGHVNRKHLNHHPYQCDICGMEYYSKITLRMHLKKSHIENYTCDYCNETFKVRSLFVKHEEICKLDRREFDCEAMTESQKKLEERKTKTHRNIQIVNELQRRECTSCDKKFGFKGEHIDHMKIHGNVEKYPCIICDIDLESTTKLYSHNFVKHDSIAQSKICSSKIERTQLDSHVQDHQTKTESSSFTCESCGKLYTSYTKLSTHKKSHLEPVPCNVCKKLVKETSLKRHMNLHVYGERRVRRKAVLKRNHKCSYCNKYFTKPVLEGHINRHHLKIKPYSCDVCVAVYSCKYQLNEHKTYHSEQKWFTCFVCSKTLRHKRAFEKHLMLHNGDRPHMCEVCGHGFITSSILKEHMLTHGEKSVACPLCDRKFYYMRAMRQHIKKYHWEHHIKEFDYKKIKGLTKEYYYIFQDGRSVVAESE